MAFMISEFIFFLASSVNPGPVSVTSICQLFWFIVLLIVIEMCIRDRAEEGIYNYRGHCQYLYQHNMRIPMPVLVSTEGYGILAVSYTHLDVYKRQQYNRIYRVCGKTTNWKMRNVKEKRGIFIMKQRS